MDDENEIIDFIHHNSFAILISFNNGKLIGSHLPMLLKEKEGAHGFLYGHMAKANTQWIDVSEDVLVIFPGAHKYISPTWYETNQAVPTWNYLSVHVYGRITILESNEDKEKNVKELIEFYEGKDSKYKAEDLQRSYFEGLLRGITAFKIEITEIEGKQKLSQNHNEDRRRRVIEQLEKNADEDSAEISRLMKKNLNEGG